MASTQEYQCLVLGDEPAGLWLLHELDRVFTAAGEKPYFGWIQFEPRRRDTLVPTSFAKYFDLPCGPTWHADLISKRGSLRWSPDGLKDRFPEIDLESIDPFPKTHHRRGSEVRAAYRALVKYPELMAYGTAFWKFFGRSPFMRPESMVLCALQCHSLTWWNPSRDLPRSVGTIDSTVKNRAIESAYFSNKGMISIQLEDQTTLLTRTLILNLAPYQLRRLIAAVPALGEGLSSDQPSGSSWARYPLEITADPEAIAGCVPPLNFFFDTLDIPSEHDEIWPFQCARDESGSRLTLWVSWPWGVAMEGLTATFRAGFKRLSHLFPFLPTQLRRLSAPLSVQCHSQQARIQLIEQLEARAVPQFETTRTHASTRRPNVFFLGGSLHAQLPYPFGPMLEARTLVTTIAGRKRQKLSRRAAADAPPPA